MDNQEEKFTNNFFQLVVLVVLQIVQQVLEVMVEMVDLVIEAGVEVMPCIYAFSATTVPRSNSRISGSSAEPTDTWSLCHNSRTSSRQRCSCAGLAYE